MIKEYLPVVFQIGGALAIALGAIITSIILGQRARRSPAKDSAYECGKDPLTKGTPRFSVKFYLVAMIFILFDIEVIFMYPWALNYLDLVSSGMGFAILWIMIAFVLIVEIGHFYAYKRGVFDWNKRD